MARSRGEGWERALDRGDHGLRLAHVQEAGLLGAQREHFGFTDGFSQPAIEGVAREDVRGQGIPYKRPPWPLVPVRWRAIKPELSRVGDANMVSNNATCPVVREKSTDRVRSG